jgi:predicted RNA-binding protein YlqC (UPF0109 family)
MHLQQAQAVDFQIELHETGFFQSQKGYAIMKTLIEFIAKSLVDDPMEVVVTEHHRQRVVHLQLSVADEDMGRVIGRNGRVANAMRTLLRVVASRKGIRADLDII